ncbi:HNH endonuclease [Enterococcus phage BC611]|uniref:HNH homing endonuclease n=1 Tax=Enterococcus phage BC611 TaxID=1173135 RepID=I4DSL7_9CAUD|nr:HNH endonuclease [Enterococcus phage BC611]BAM20907.1 HNH homing endonuclease [Enterococcus phage BC611]
MNEEWLDIKGYEGLYQISNLGRVKSLSKRVVYSNGSIREVPEKILTPSESTQGYLKVNFFKDKKPKTKYIHKLVYVTFVSEVKEGNQLNHINECKFDNTLANLEEVTAKENINHGTRTMRQAWFNSKPVKAVSVEDGSVKLFPSASQASREGFSRRHISNVCKGKEKTHLGYVWEYLAKDEFLKETSLEKSWRVLHE